MFNSSSQHSCLCTLKENNRSFKPKLGCQDSPGALATPRTRNSEEECDVYTVEVGMAEFPACTYGTIRLMAHSKEQKRVNSQKVRDERRQLALERLGGVCTHCGTTDNLQLDHIDASTKTCKVSALWTSRIEVFLTELDKCQLLCVPCHNEKTRLERFGERVHGSQAMYQRGKCRCSICKEGARLRTQEYRKRKKQEQQ